MQCTGVQADIDLIKSEIGIASAMADGVSKNLLGSESKDYWEGFIPQVLRDIPAVGTQLKDEYKRAAGIKGDGNSAYTLKVTCDNTAKKCENGYYASMTDKTNTMNICDAWFDIKGTKATVQLEKTADLIAGCKGDSPKYKNLMDFWGQGRMS